MLGQHGGGLGTGDVDAHCRKINGLQPGVTTRVDSGIGFQIHIDVERHAVIGAVLRDLDAQCRDFAEAGEVLRVVLGNTLLRALGEHGVAARVIEPYIHARGMCHTVAGDAEMRQGADHGFFQAVDVFLDEIARAAQVDQRIGHDLARAMEGDLAAAVALHHGNGAGREQVIGLACNALREHGVVLAQPELVGGVGGAACGEALHGKGGVDIVDPPEFFHQHGYVWLLVW
ncbi:hypothetical protein SDC9_112346 [bioreactor metagenome]|uniref:Uncharacterized protein n=1 Tax=bioreactor metagenome TaxID=1076179 RepID=A0A645BJ05_9ZZZZ